MTGCGTGVLTDPRNAINKTDHTHCMLTIECEVSRLSHRFALPLLDFFHDWVEIPFKSHPTLIATPKPNIPASDRIVGNNIGDVGLTEAFVEEYDIWEGCVTQPTH